MMAPPQRGTAGALKYVFGPAAVAEIRRLHPTAWDSLADGKLLRPYADLRFTYDALRRVRRERVDGFESAYEFQWLQSASTPTSPNTWANLATETRPDGSTLSVLSNASGAAILKVFHDAVTDRDYREAWLYDETTGRLLEHMPHTAIDSTTLPADENSTWTVAGSLTLHSGTGAVSVYEYYAENDATSPGRFHRESVRAGASGSTRLLREREYAARSGPVSPIVPLHLEKVFFSAVSGDFTTVRQSYTYADDTLLGFGSGVGTIEDIEQPTANDVSADTVFEQEQPQFDAAGNVILTTRWLRLHSTPETEHGPLDGPAAASAAALRSYAAYWPDALGRVHSTADYGTNNGAVLTRPDLCPGREATPALVSVSRWLVPGAPEAYESTAPDGTVTRWENDPVGRRIRLWENYNSAKGPEHLDANRLTEYTYHISGQLSILTAWNRKLASGSSTVTLEAQQTRWAYGTTLAESGLATGHLLRAKIYPDSDDTAANPAPTPGNGPDAHYRRSEFRYNRLGEVTTFTDPAATVHAYDFDQHGRLLEDAVTLPGDSPLDDSVLRIGREYAEDGRSVTITSYDAPSGGTRVNQVKLIYNPWGQLTEDRQSHTSSPASASGTPTVSYAYEDGGTNTLRRTGMTYPSGREVGYEFAATGSPDSKLGRLTALGYRVSGTTTPELAFTYCGVAMPVSMLYPQNGVLWSLLPQADDGTPSATNPYPGLDRFGRLLKARWVTNIFNSGDPDPVQVMGVHVNYTYDRASRRSTRRLPGTSQEAEVYAYDGLSQVKWRKRGAEEIEGDTFIGILAPPQRQEDFSYDTLGNWQRYYVQAPDTGTPPALATVFDQNRTHNPANQITSFSNTTQPVLHDAAGNTTASAPVPDSGTIDWNAAHQYQWDAWNRLVRITHSTTGAEIARHAYDGLTRRTTLQEGGPSGTVRHFYYNDQWRSIEERTDTNATPERHHLFNPLNCWHLIRRDLDSDNNGSFNQTLYSLHDAMDPIAITNASGTILERYNYSAFGMRRVMDADYDNKTSGTEFEWNWEFHGEFSDGASWLHNYGWRYYIPTTGRWPSSDPAGEIEGTNMMAYSGNSAISFIDVHGLGKEKVFGWVVKLEGPNYVRTVTLHTMKRASQYWAKGCNILVRGGRRNAEKLAKQVIDKVRRLHHEGHRIQPGNWLGRPHFQDHKIEGRHIFYTLVGATLLAAQSDSDAGDAEVPDGACCGYELNEVYSDEYPGPSFTSYGTIKHWVGEDSAWAALDWINPIDFVASLAEIGRNGDRESAKKFLGYTLTVFSACDKGFTVALDENGDPFKVTYQGAAGETTVSSEELSDMIGGFVGAFRRGLNSLHSWLK